MKVLHIIRRQMDSLEQEVIDHGRTAGGVTILLIQDGVLSRVKAGDEVFASVNDVEARGVRVQYNLVDYPVMCQLIIEHDKVIVW